MGNITSDKFIIDIVRKAIRINFTQKPPNRQPFEYIKITKGFPYH